MAAVVGEIWVLVKESWRARCDMGGGEPTAEGAAVNLTAAAEAVSGVGERRGHRHGSAMAAAGEKK